MNLPIALSLAWDVDLELAQRRALLGAAGLSLSLDRRTWASLTRFERDALSHGARSVLAMAELLSGDLSRAR